MNFDSSAPESYDVVVIGGALSGSATATLILKDHPAARVLILERTTRFNRKVGEATVEVSTYFLSRMLGLTQYLNEHHIVKQGLRFWFTNEQTRSMDECSEVGARYMVRVPSYQVDRSTLDEEVLRRAVAIGAKLLRPATVQSVKLQEGGEQLVLYKLPDDPRVLTVKARWVIDASGPAAFLARQEKWIRPNAAHPTAAVWSRWKGVKDWDGLELAQKFPSWAGHCYGVRGTATNHLMGLGWWSWWIPLKGGDVSIGLVFDQRLVALPQEGSLGERMRRFLTEQHPVGKELLSDATWTEGDVYWRKNLPYSSDRFSGDGFILVGDAAGFIDPFYSPGIDWISFTTHRAAQIITEHLQGRCVKVRVDRYQTDFRGSYDRWFDGIYRNKYFYMGEYDLMRMAFVLDLGMYYLGVAAQPYKRGRVSFNEPIFCTKPSIPAYYLMRTYNRRFSQIAAQRQREGRTGKLNRGERFMFGGFTFEHSSSKHVVKGLLQWILLELKEGWKSWFRTYPEMDPMKADANASLNSTMTESSPASSVLK